jgi:hypothetical protein
VIHSLECNSIMAEEEKVQHGFGETGTPEEELELPISTHESLVRQDNEEREEMDFHNKITSSISRAALKDSLGDRVKLSYDGEYVDEDEKECLDEDTRADAIKRMRAERLASQRKEVTKNQRMMMQRVAAEKEGDIGNDYFKIGRAVLNKEVTKVTGPGESRPTISTPSENENHRAVWDDFGCGMCFDSAAWAKTQYEQHFLTTYATKTEESS